MAYVDINTLQTYNPGDILTAAALQQIRTNEEFLVDPPLCAVSHSTAQSVPNSTMTILSADTETFDNDSMHSTETNNSRLTTQTAGRYRLSTRIEFASSGTGAREIRFYKNGASLGAAYLTSPNAGTLVVTTYTEQVCVAGDYFEVGVVQTSGGALNVRFLAFSAMFLSR